MIDEFGKSFIWIKKRRDPKIEPCGTFTRGEIGYLHILSSIFQIKSYQIMKESTHAVVIQFR